MRLGEKIAAEGGAILKWAIAGLAKLPPDKFTSPASSVELNETVERSSSDIVAFAADRLEFGVEFYADKQKLYDRFLEWWRLEEKPLSTKLSRERFFKSFLEQYGGKVANYQPPKEPDRPRPTRRYNGVRLLGDDEIPF